MRVTLDPSQAIWDNCYMVFPLVVVATSEPDGSHDMAPKHLAMPLSWQNHFGFVCTPRHATYRNARRTGMFTVSFLRPDQVVLASLAAAPRCDDDIKHSLAALPTVPATKVDGVLLDDAYLQLECEVDRIVDDLDANSLVIGRIVAAHIDEDSKREVDVDDQELLAQAPLLVYLHPGRYASIRESFSFPFHKGFSR